MFIKRSLFEELFRSLHLSADPTDDTADGGGTVADDPAGDDEALGEGGKKTLQKLRAELKAAERRLKAVEGLDPKIYQQATTKADELERQLREREALTEAEKLRLEQKHSELVTAARAEAEKEKQARVRLETRTAAKAAFEQAKGQVGSDNDGRTFFDGFMALVGERHLRIDESGSLYVVDAAGDPVPSPDGKGRIAPDAWMKGLSDNSPVIGTFFQSAMGSGSGMGNSRGPGTRGLPSLKDLSPAERRRLAWESDD